MPTCWHCQAETPGEHYERIVYGKERLHGPWEGWRLAGRHLVAPDGARITPERLRGILFQEANRRRRQVKRDPAALLVLPAREVFRGQA